MKMEHIIFNNICREIMRECKNRGIRVSEKFIAYYVRLLLLEPKWNISLKLLEINRIDLQNLVKHTYTTLEDEFNPSVIALKMQMYFTCSFDEQEDVIINHRKKLHSQLQPLDDEILNASSEDEDDLNRLYRLIVNYLTLKHGLGNPAIPVVYREAEIALKSVFNKKDLLEFAKQSKDAKHEELENLSGLLCGIRLFNRDCKKGGHGIEDLPTLLSQAIELTYEDLQKSLSDIVEIVNTITTALDTSYKVVKEDGHDVLKLMLVDETKYRPYIEKIKDLLVVFRQFEAYVRKMIASVSRIRDKVEAILLDFDECLKQINSIVLYKTVVQASSIFPHFSHLAYVWNLMQNQVIYLSSLNQILGNLQAYSEQVQHYDDVLIHLIGSKKILKDADRLEKTGFYRLAVLGCKPTKIMNPRKIPNFEGQPLEFLGFCAWKFVESNGALIPGNPGNGVVEVKSRYYVFSCLEGVHAFVDNPERYINRALEIGRRKPELINFLRLYQQLNEVKSIPRLVPPILITVLSNDVEVQTEVHPVRTNIDPKYMWNIWDWKRQALKWADIGLRKTKSTQTNLSNWKNPVRVQTEFKKSHNYQTKQDNYSNVPIPSNYIFGLRGRKDDKQFIITLTRPVEE